ncbi:MAG: hypothetical protein A3G87_06685 [Omnitrophica bacterium RIFCSPLOWO2_12_FULL_50_11]|nr:MAG: hypothetical protein A3G87_06685 [Omnitrophica bacterium RIFCSPLOWO2_12_FULL_50_11]
MNPFFQIETAHPTTYSCAEGALALWAKNRWWDHPEARPPQNAAGPPLCLSPQGVGDPPAICGGAETAERISLMRSLASLGMRGGENTPTPHLIRLDFLK